MASEGDEIDEIIVYITGMRRAFNRKLDDHLFIIQQQATRLEEHTRIIDDQKQIIDELAWQIRDLRDSVRKVAELSKAKHCICKQDTHHHHHHQELKLTNSGNNNQNNNKKHSISKLRQSIIDDQNHDNEVYENFYVKHGEPSPKPAQRSKISTIDNPPEEFTRPLNPTVDNVDKQKRTTRYICPQIAKVPNSNSNTTTSTNNNNTNNNNNNNNDTNNTNKNTSVVNKEEKPSSLSEAETQQTNTLFNNNNNHTTIPNSTGFVSTKVSSKSTASVVMHTDEMHLNNEFLTDNRKIKALSDHNTMDDLKFLDIRERDSIDEEVGDIMFRAKEFKRYSSNSKRGSSKVLWSLISDIEEDYLPHEDEITEENIVDIKQREVVSDAVFDYNNNDSDNKMNINRMGVYKSTRK